MVNAFVQGIYDDDAGDARRREGIHDQILELRCERILRYEGILLYDANDLASECGVSACELMCKCGKDLIEFLSVGVVPRAEEACTEGPIVRNHFGECLGNGRLPRSH